MLVVDTTVLDVDEEADILQVVLTHPEVRRAANAFLQQSTAPVPATDRHLDVVQSEEAGMTYSEQQTCYIGSEAATTCLIAAVVCPESKIAWVAHFDNQSTCLRSRLLAAISTMPTPHVFLVGAYDEPTHAGATLVRSFLAHLHNRPQHVRLSLACIHALNTAPSGAPAAQSLAVKLPSLTAAPATFASHEPQPVRRSLQMQCMERGMACIATPRSPTLTLPPFDPRKPSWAVMTYERMLALPAEQLLQHTSTSPQHELPAYVAAQRAGIAWLLRAQDDPSMAERELRYIWEEGRGYVECPPRPPSPPTCRQLHYPPGQLRAGAEGSPSRRSPTALPYGTKRP